MSVMFNKPITNHTAANAPIKITVSLCMLILIPCACCDEIMHDQRLLVNNIIDGNDILF